MRKTEFYVRHLNYTLKSACMMINFDTDLYCSCNLSLDSLWQNGAQLGIIFFRMVGDSCRLKVHTIKVLGEVSNKQKVSNSVLAELILLLVTIKFTERFCII